MRKIAIYLILLIYMGLGLYGDGNITNKSYNKHVEKIRTYPTDIFDKNSTIIISKPFIIITNISDNLLKN